MQRIKLLLGLVAAVFATFAAYSFSRSSVPEKSSTDASQPPTHYYIKYDCRASASPTIVSTGTNYTTSAMATDVPGYNANCGGVVSFCAKRFPINQTEDVPGQPGNKRPINPNQAPSNFVQCHNIVP